MTPGSNPFQGLETNPDGEALKAPIELNLLVLGIRAKVWLDRIENSSSGLTAAFHRSLRSREMRRSLDLAESDLKIQPAPGSSLEARLLAVTIKARENHLDSGGLEALMPRLEVVAQASMNSEHGTLKRTADVRRRLKEIRSGK